MVYVDRQDHNYTAPLPCTPPLSPPSPTRLGGTAVAAGVLGGAVPLDDPSAGAGAAGIKEVIVTTTTGDDPCSTGVGDDSVTRCICDFQHDDGYMICCDQCGSVLSHLTLTRHFLPRVAYVPDPYLLETFNRQ